MKKVFICFFIGLIIGVICALVSNFFFEINPIIAGVAVAFVGIIFAISAQVKRFETNHNGNVIKESC